MSLLPRFALNRHRAQEKALEQQVTALRSALDQCKGMAKRWTEVRLEVMAIIAVVFMGLGFALGVYREPLQRSAGDGAGDGGHRQLAAGFQDRQRGVPEGRVPAALRLAQPLADEGDARAQSIVAQIHYRGRGVPQSDTEAATWFRRAADQGDALAQFYLGGDVQRRPRRAAGLRRGGEVVPARRRPGRRPRRSTISASPTPAAKGDAGPDRRAYVAQPGAGAAFPPPTAAAARRRPATATAWRAR